VTANRRFSGIDPIRSTSKGTAGKGSAGRGPRLSVVSGRNTGLASRLAACHSGCQGVVPRGDRPAVCRAQVSRDPPRIPTADRAADTSSIGLLTRILVGWEAAEWSRAFLGGRVLAPTISADSVYDCAFWRVTMVASGRPQQHDSVAVDSFHSPETLLGCR
jgi:hypothetical protein